MTDPGSSPKKSAAILIAAVLLLLVCWAGAPIDGLQPIERASAAEQPEFETVQIVFTDSQDNLTVDWTTTGSVSTTDITILDPQGETINLKGGDTNPYVVNQASGNKEFGVPSGQSAYNVTLNISNAAGHRFCYITFTGDGTFTLASGDLTCDDKPQEVTTGSGTTEYTGGGGPVTVDPNVHVNGSDKYIGANVTITDGFDPGADDLAVDSTYDFSSSGVSLVGYNSTTGVLKLDGTASSSAYQSALRSVTYDNAESPPSTTDRNITFELTSANGTIREDPNVVYNPTTERYYEYVRDAGVTWTEARGNANSSTYAGMTGYLATVRSSSENAFLLDRFRSPGWIGASDAGSEGEWHWVTGPEGSQNTTSHLFGVEFFDQTAAHVAFTEQYPDPPDGVPGGGTGVNGEYSNWDPRHEPNNKFPFFGGQDYGYLCFGPPRSCPDGMWKDASSDSPPFTAAGYFIEYGGPNASPNTQTANFTDSKTVTVSPATSDGTSPTANAGSDQTVGPGEDVTLDASGSSDNGENIVRYEWDTTGNGRADLTGETVTTNFTNASERTVTLRITDSGGDTDTDTVLITVSDTNPPSAVISVDGPTTVERGETVRFTGTNSTDDVAVGSFEWDFGDGSANSSALSPEHGYSETGTYTVALTVNDTGGNADSATATIDVQSSSRPHIYDFTATNPSGTDLNVSIDTDQKLDQITVGVFNASELSPRTDESDALVFTADQTDFSTNESDGNYTYVNTTTSLDTGEYTARLQRAENQTNGDSGSEQKATETVTADSTEPSFSPGYPTTDNTRTNSFDVEIKTDESGTAYYVVVPDESGQPSNSQIKNGHNATGGSAVANETGSVSADAERSFTATGLQNGTSYDVYVLVEDAAGNANVSGKIEEQTVNEEGIVYVDGTLRSISTDGTVVDYGVSDVETIGPRADIDGDGNREVPFVTSNGKVKIVNESGSTDTLGEYSSVSARKSKSQLAIGDWDSDGNYDVFFASQEDSENIYRIDWDEAESGDTPENLGLVDGNTAGAAQFLIGSTDITGDGIRDLVFVTGSSSLYYVNGTGANVKLSGSTFWGADNNVGFGEPADMTGSADTNPTPGDYTYPIIGSGQQVGVAANNQQLTTTTFIDRSEAEEAATAAPWTADDIDDHIYIASSDGGYADTYLRYRQHESVGSKTGFVTDTDGNKVTASDAIGVTSRVSSFAERESITRSGAAITDPQYESAVFVDETTINVTISDDNDVDESTVQSGDFSLSSNRISSIDTVDLGTDTNVTITLSSRISTDIEITIDGSIGDVDSNTLSGGTKTVTADGPAFQAGEARAREVELQFDEAVNVTAGTSGFSVLINGTDQTLTSASNVTDVASNITLSLSDYEPVAGDNVTVSYDDTANNVIDEGGVEAAAFTNSTNEDSTFTNIAPAAAPVFQTGEADSQRIEVEFDRAVNVTADRSGFTVEVNGTEQSIASASNVTDTASNVTLSLSEYEIVASDNVSVSYDGTSDNLINTDGIEAGAFSTNTDEDGSFVNVAPAPAPTFQAGKANSQQIEIEFSEAVNVTAGTSGFSVLINGASRSLAGAGNVTDAASNITLSLSEYEVIASDNVSVSYDGTSDNLVTTDGVETTAFSANTDEDGSFVNVAPAPAPIFQTGEADSQQIELGFDRAVNVTADTSGFSVLVNDTAQTLAGASNVTHTASNVTLTLSEYEIVASDNVSVSYDGTSDNVVNTDGVEAGPFGTDTAEDSSFSNVASGDAPVFQTGEADAQQIELEFDRPVNVTADASGFSVLVNGTEQSLAGANNVTETTSNVTLTLSEYEIVTSDNVSVSYDGTSDNLVNTDGVEADQFSRSTDEDRTFVNEAPTATQPVISTFGVENPTGRDVTISFDSDKQLSTIEVSVTEAEAATLTESAFSETKNRDGTYTYNTTYAGSTDGDYTVSLVTAEGTDGNNGASGESGSVTVDTTPPSISSYEVNNPSGRAVTVSFGSDEQVTEISVSISGAETATVTESAFTEIDNGDGTYTYNVSYDGSTDGTYTATLETAEDSDSNDGASGESGSVTVDTTPPSISSFDVINPSGQDVTVSFESDEQLSKILLSISGAESAGLTESEFSETDIGGGYSYEATYSGSSDGDYTGTLDEARDAAGNDGASGESDSVTVQTADAAFTRTNLTVEPTEVTVGDSVTVGVDIENTGTASGSYGLVITVDDNSVFSDTRRSLSPGEQVRETVNVSLSEVGEREIGISDIDDGSSPVTVTVIESAPKLSITQYSVDETTLTEGETIEVNATVENTGDAAGNITVPLVVDNRTVATRDVAVSAGGTGTVTFQRTFDTAGEYDLSVDSLSPTTVTVESAAPAISAFRVSNPTDQNVSVSFDSDEPLETIIVSVSGAASTTLSETAFTETDSGDGYTYEATYNASRDGVYTATLETAEDADGTNGAGGETDSVSVDRQVTAVASANSYVVTVGSPVELRAGESVIPKGATPTIEWEQAGETVGTGETISAAWDTPGERAVNLTISTETGSDRATVTIDVVDETPPDVRLDAPERIAFGDVVTFDASASSDNVGIEQFEWAFGDGTTASGPDRTQPTHTYEETGTYTVTLQVTDTSGNTATGTTELSVDGADSSVSTTAVEFGTVSVGSSGTETVSLTNDGSRALNVSALSLTGSDADVFAVDTDATTVRPGETTNVVVSFAPERPGERTALLDLESNNVTPLGPIAVNGTAVEGGLEPVDSEVSFGEVAVGESATAELTVENTGSGPVEIDETTVDDPFSIGGESGQVSLDPGERHTVTVRFVPTTSGEVGETVLLTGPDATATVGVVGTGTAPALSLSPEELAFQPTGVGDTVEATVEVSNYGNDDLELDTVDIIGGDRDEFRLDDVPTTVAPGETEPFDLLFEPEESGQRSANLSVHSNDPTAESIDVPVSATAVGAEIGIDRRTIDFGNVTIGERVLLNVTVTNKATSLTDLTVERTDIVGKDTDSFEVENGGAPFSLDPGESQVIELAFEPLSAGVKQAQLQIISDAADRPLINVWLANTRTYILVQEVNAIEGNSSESALSVGSTANIVEPAIEHLTDADPATVNVDGFNLVDGGTHAVNVTTPAVEARDAGVDVLDFEMARDGNFELNLNYDDLPHGPVFRDEETTAAEYIEIEHLEGIPTETYKNTAIEFRVRKKALRHGEGPGDATLYRYNESRNEWTDLSEMTTVVGESDSYYRYEADLPGFSQFVIAVPQQSDPAFEIESVTTGDPVLEGETLDVATTIENTGGSGEETVALRLGETTVDSKALTLDGGESETVTLQYETERGDADNVDLTVATAKETATTTAAVQSPPRLEITDAGANDPVTEGEVVDVTATVENTGDVKAEQSVDLVVDGTTVDSIETKLGGGDSETVTLLYQTAEAGTVELQVSTEDDSSDLSAIVGEADEDSGDSPPPGSDESEFTIVDLDTTAAVTEGEPIDVAVTIQNTGGAAGNGAVELLVDGVADEADVRLKPGERASVNLTYGTTVGDAPAVAPTVETEDDEEATTATVDPKPRLVLSNATADDPVTVGDSLPIAVDVENPGWEPTSGTVTLYAESDPVDALNLSVAGEKRERISFDYRAERSGALDLSLSTAADELGLTANVTTAPATANLVVDGIQTNGTVTAGETVDTTATVENTGANRSGTVSIAVETDDGTLEELGEKTLALDSGQRARLRFSYETDESDVPSITVQVIGDGEGERATVNIEQTDSEEGGDGRDNDGEPTGGGDCELFGYDFGSFIVCWYWWVLLFLVLLAILIASLLSRREEEADG